MEKKKEKDIRITITLKKTLDHDSGVSINNKSWFEVNYDGKIPKETIEIILEKIKSKIIDLDRQIDKNAKNN